MTHLLMPRFLHIIIIVMIIVVHKQQLTKWCDKTQDIATKTCESDKRETVRQNGRDSDNESLSHCHPFCRTVMGEIASAKCPMTYQPPYKPGCDNRTLCPLHIVSGQR